MQAVLVFIALRTLGTATSSLVEITDNDRTSLISERENFTLTCTLTYKIFRGMLYYNQTTEQLAYEHIIEEESRMYWQLPNGTVLDVFNTAKTQSWQGGLTFTKQHELQFTNASKVDEGVYKCYGKAVIQQRSKIGENFNAASAIFSRNSSDVYHVLVKKPGKVFVLMRPAICVSEGQKAEWVGMFGPFQNDTLKVTSWKAFDDTNEATATSVGDIPRLAEKSSISYELDGKNTKFGFPEFYLTNSRVSADDPAHYIVTVDDGLGRSKAQHLQLIVEATTSDIQVEITPLTQESYNVGDYINITCTMRRVEPHTNRYMLHFAQCDDVEKCTEQTAAYVSSIVYAYPYGNPCWDGLAAPPPKARPEAVTILNHQVQASGVFFCGRMLFDDVARMPLIVPNSA